MKVMEKDRLIKRRGRGSEGGYGSILIVNLIGDSGRVKRGNLIELV
jgi:hypothetical protein